MINKNVSIKQFVQDMELEVCVSSSEDTMIATSEVNRIGLQLMEFYEFFAEDRIQIIGKGEWSYLNHLESDRRRAVAETFFSYHIPCLIFTRDLEVFPEFVEVAKERNKRLLRTHDTTTKFISKVLNYLDDKLADTITLHGVLVDVHGVGILILGKSGVGKSETALELIKRGHRFIADDAIQIKKTNDNKLIGTAPDLIKNFLEIRGIGILDVSRLYGSGATRAAKFIDLVVKFELWDEKKAYDRLGIDDKFTNILDLEVAQLEIPVKPGRNLAIILEAAAINHRQKQMGYNAAIELDRRMRENM